MAATDILGKIGEKVGTQINSLSTDIATNATDIATNATNIATNTSGIATNASAIATNATDIATNASNIATNTTDIATNASNIATNATNIATNTSGIASNLSAIQSNDTDISALQTRTGSLAVDGNSASFSGDLGAANLTLSGNLTVSGTQTILNTQTLEVEDNIIEVNLTASDGSETQQTGGLQVNRGKLLEARGIQSASDSGQVGYFEIVAGGQYSGLAHFRIRFGESADSVSIQQENGVDFLYIDSTASGMTVNQLISFLSGYADVTANILTSAPSHASHLTDFATGSATVSMGSGSLTSVTSSQFSDKAKLVWDDSVSKFQLKLGAVKASLDVGNVDAEELKVPTGADILINNVQLGNYASFEAEFLANL